MIPNFRRPVTGLEKVAETIERLVLASDWPRRSLVWGTNVNTFR